mmetsp:Transcript_124509/g.265419  ORF Transcript_124509/g.265419 Transcript_124509/m.265419 type:complete len:734 (-) Transcript_124509:9-2210(-)
MSEEIGDGEQGALSVLRSFLISKEGTCLRAWRRHFDKAFEHSVGLGEFLSAMRAMNYPQDARLLFRDLDNPKTGELSLDEISPEESSLWGDFRSFSVGTFKNATDFIMQLVTRERKDIRHEVMESLDETKRSSKECIKEALLEAEKAYKSVDRERCFRWQFCEGIRRKGWTGGHEEDLFACLAISDSGFLMESDLKWFGIEVQRMRHMQQARHRGMNIKAAGQRDQDNELALLCEFKHFLKQKYGSYVRAWRNHMCVSDSMVLYRAQLTKACAEMGWFKNTPVLWRALDKDDSGHVTIDELDERSAITLAKFGNFVRAKFGNTSQAYRAMAPPSGVKFTRQVFVKGLEAHGFNEPGKIMLFHGLDIRGKNCLRESDIAFLDKWHALPFLLANPNEEAANEVRALILRRYKSHLKAWRHLLDKDGSNRCNWYEFESACKTIGYTGDTAGAWRALDNDMSGFITLLEVDPVSNDIIVAFKRWADEGFGSVKAMFEVFDDDHSGEISKREFCKACRIYAFKGNPRGLFQALDADNKGAVTRKDLVFLDSWLIESVSQEPEDVAPATGARQSVGDDDGGTTSPEARVSVGMGRRHTIMYKRGGFIHIPLNGPLVEEDHHFEDSDKDENESHSTESDRELLLIADLDNSAVKPPVWLLSRALEDNYGIQEKGDRRRKPLTSLPKVRAAAGMAGVMPTLDHLLETPRVGPRGLLATRPKAPPSPWGNFSRTAWSLEQIL